MVTREGFSCILRDLNEMREEARQVTGGSAFWAEGTAYAQARKQEQTVAGLPREKGRVKGDEVGERAEGKTTFRLVSVGNGFGFYSE